MKKKFGQCHVLKKEEVLVKVYQLIAVVPGEQGARGVTVLTAGLLVVGTLYYPVLVLARLEGQYLLLLR